VTRTPPFQRYVALGDSISIDEYPALDWQEIHNLARQEPGLGAASLLYRNDDEAWPEFRAQDLRTLCPGLEFDTLAEDGCRTAGVLDRQLPRLGGGDARPTLVTLTVGGNDLLQLLGSGQPPERAHADDVVRRIEQILDRLGELLPHRTVLLGTVYDPSDGGSMIMGIPLGPAERAVLDRVNDGIRTLAKSREQVILADIHAHFHGHGVSAPTPERWYWRHMIIEPSARGASEVRRLWLEALAGRISTA